ncbi:MAG: hypothetical protein GF418_03955 [Chitinivibrionales bacterium]|nr:hypothetical protein [Chitinivibrionales bacterium]MBD3394760.1 hypothetical protein [Chitinivibrionales bacterium]
MTSGRAQEHPKKVLWIGNSYSAWWGGPAQHCEGIASRDDPAVEMTCERHTFDGESLRGHLENESRGTLDRIRDGDWDIVVLQDFSRRPMQDRDGFREDAMQLHEEIAAIGAETVFFMTWGYEDSASWPGMFEATAASYEAVAGELGCRIAPCNKAWLRVLAGHPEIDMWADGSHPTPIAQYLNGCVFYALFTGESPEGSSYLQFEDRLDESQAAVMQQIAWETVLAYEWPNVPAPVVEPAGDTLPIPVQVQAGVLMGGAAVHYTLDGTSPTKESPVLDSVLHVDHTALLTLKSIKPGFGESRAVAVRVGEQSVAAANRDRRVWKAGAGQWRVSVGKGGLSVLAPYGMRHTLRLVTVDGRMVCQRTSSGVSEHRITATGLAGGVYVAHVRAGQQEIARQVILGK